MNLNMKVIFKKLSIPFVFLTFGFMAFAQQQQLIKYQIDYSNNYHTISSFGIVSDKYADVMSFYNVSDFRPVLLLNYTIQDIVFEEMEADKWKASQITNEEFDFNFEIRETKGKYQSAMHTFPYRKTSKNTIQILKSYTVAFDFDNISTRGLRDPNATFNSVLSSGDIYKIKVQNTGIYKLDRKFFETDLGINPNNINPKQIKIYGSRGGRLPEPNRIERIDDLQELHIFVEGEADNKFDNSDFVLFYGEGADVWKYDKTLNNFGFDKNIYDDYNYYFIKVSGDVGLRISNAEDIQQTPEKSTVNYDFLQRFEEDKINLLGAFAPTFGTGKDWYGDVFSQGNRTRNYTSRFNFSDLDISEPVAVEMAFAGRSPNVHTIQLTLGGERLSRTINSVSFSAANASENVYAGREKITGNVQLSSPNPSVEVAMLDNVSNSLGWLDYLQIVSKRRLVLATDQMGFRNRELKDVNWGAFELNNYSNQTIWDVSNPLQPLIMKVNGNKIVFRPEGQVKEFISFSGVSSAFTPIAEGKIPNQNLHAMNDEDMIIVYHPEFEAEATRLAQHRASIEGMKVLMASTVQVYNEFGGGKADPTAIRDMAKLLLYRNENFQFLLLFGDASYDYKGINKDINYENFVPTYQTDESLIPINGYPTDDYFGLLGENEGQNISQGSMDIHVGRLTVRNKTEAQNVVNKIIHYDTNKNKFGDWRLRNGFVADDGDTNLHVSDMDRIAKSNELRHPNHNQEKVYIDAYKLVSTSGEPRFPDANKAINNNVFKGQVSLTYLGHGGPLGWAQERILTVPDIQNMNNMDALTLMITATCSFGSYDDPALTSPAEHALLNARGGAIALMTTSRVVYTNSNFQLTNAVHDVLKNKENGKAPTLGSIMTNGKNRVPNSNSRKFSLLGDPSQRIALPQHNVVTTQLNGKDIISEIDTLRALSKVTFSGIITDDNNQKLSSFNGTLSATIYDKKSQLQTLSNTVSSPKFNFEMYRNILFKGTVSVINGEWTVSFWVPQNIDYRFGYGRLSLYAFNEETDAAGVFNDFIIGGTNENLVNDNEGPKIEAFMNDTNFANGGMTNSNPTLLLNLSDDLGINVTGNAIGQDITATLDGDTKNIFILNDFYEANKDDFTSGRVRFPMRNLTPGSHYITAKAWDISGNFNETRLDFVVVENSDNKLRHVYNYPNPFTSQTTFQFEHDMPNTELSIVIQIYSITGKLVKSIENIKYSSGFRVNDIFWNGNDDFESKLARGIYLYKVTAHSKELNQTRESGFEKLVKL